MGANTSAPVERQHLRDVLSSKESDFYAVKAARRRLQVALEVGASLENDEDIVRTSHVLKGMVKNELAALASNVQTNNASSSTELLLSTASADLWRKRIQIEEIEALVSAAEGEGFAEEASQARSILKRSLATLNAPTSADCVTQASQSLDANDVKAKPFGSIIQWFSCDTYKHFISSLVCVVVL